MRPDKIWAAWPRKLPTGCVENTVLIFMSDNGMTGGGSGRVGVPMGRQADGTSMMLYNAGMKGQKGSADEGGVRVPFFVRWDGKIQAGKDVDRIAAHIDILPTLAALAGASIPENQVEGRNLLPLIEDPQTNWEDRYLFTHKGRWPTGSEPNDFRLKDFAVRSDRYRFVTNDSLYDMWEDPGQTKNIISEHPEMVAKMRAAYDAFWNEARPMMVNEEAPMSPTRPFHVLYDKQFKSSGIPDWTPPAL